MLLVSVSADTLCPRACALVIFQDALRSQGRGRKWWRKPDGESFLEGHELVNSDASPVSSRELCQKLFLEAAERGVRINGKICSAVMLGFGSDLAVSGKLWRCHAGESCVLPMLPSYTRGRIFACVAFGTKKGTLPSEKVEVQAVGTTIEIDLGLLIRRLMASVDSLLYIHSLFIVFRSTLHTGILRSPSPCTFCYCNCS